MKFKNETIFIPSASGEPSKEGLELRFAKTPKMEMEPFPKS